MAVFFDGDPINGTADADIIIERQTDNVTGGGDDDLILGDFDFFFRTLGGNSGGSFATAFDISANTNPWTTFENPLFGDDSIPHLTILVEPMAGSAHWWEVTLGAGETITLDVDSWGYAPIADTSLGLYDSTGALLVSGLDAAITLGGEGSQDTADAYLTFTASMAGTYFFQVQEADGSFDGDEAFLLNVSVAGHPVSNAEISTGGEDDLIAGSGGSDLLMGAGGNDTLLGGSSAENFGADHLFGGSGDDSITAFAQGSMIDGGSGDDVITLVSLTGLEVEGGSGTDTLDQSALSSGGGSPIIYWSLALGTHGTSGFNDPLISTFSGIENFMGLRTPDAVRGTGGANRIDGNDGDDALEGLGGDDTLDGGTGDDTIAGGAGADSMDGGDGIDTLDYSASQQAVDITLTNATGFGDAAGDLFFSFENVIGGEGADNISGDDGDNLLDGGNQNDTLFGGLGDDTLIGSAGEDFLSGGGGADLAIGSVRQDLILGGGGNDTLNGNNGDDGIDGGRGGDRINAGPGDDTVNGEIGNDIISGNNGLDQIFGGNGGDTVNGGALSDFINGDANNDVLHGNGGDDVVNGGSGGDVILGQANNDQLFGEQNNDTISGNGGDDTVSGGTGVDTLRGNAGNDLLEGDAGDDRLLGGNGDDLILGGLGEDRVSGGSGADKFFFDEGESGSSIASADIIADFSQSDRDTISLAAIDAITGGGNDAFDFIGTAAFSGTAGELRYEQTGGDTHIFTDTDGDGTADFALRLLGDVDLVAGDFVL